MPSPLSPRQRAVLAAVCDTLLPTLRRDDDRDGLYSTGAQAANTLERVERLIADLPDPGDRTRLGLLLSALDSRIAGLLVGDGPRKFSALALDGREAVLRRWATSRLPAKRAGFQALKRLVHFAYACWPVPGGSHPAWKASGYPGPLPQPEPREALPALTVHGDSTFDCDTVVIGSGAGGGVVAGLLAEAGRDVLVLEKGPNPGNRDFTQVEGDMLGSLFLDGGTLMTRSGSMPILAGSCVGGGTVVNWTTSFPLPERIREEWSAQSGLPLFTSDRFGESLRRVLERLDVGTRWSTPGTRDVLLERGCRALGWHVAAIPRNVTGCKEGLECGFCGYGCRHGAKNSTAQTYLASATRHGARLLPCCDVERVTIERGRATGAVGTVRSHDGRAHRVTVRANHVVVACGAIYTPALLLRSGVSRPALGRNLHLHPVSGVIGRFPERVEPWGGALQTRYSQEFAYLDANYGFRFETGPIHFALPASAFGWEGAARWRADIADLAHLGVAGILLRDRGTGRVTVSRAGRPRIHYEVSDYDVRNMRRGLEAGARLLAAAGAEQLFTLQTPPTRARSGDARWLEGFMQAADRTGYSRFRMSYISFHQMGTAAMGADPARSVVNADGACHDVRDLYVADGSAFPASSGVNPMITIMAIADHVGRGLVERG